MYLLLFELSVIGLIFYYIIMISNFSVNSKWLYVYTRFLDHENDTKKKTIGVYRGWKYYDFVIKYYLIFLAVTYAFIYNIIFFIKSIIFLFEKDVYKISFLEIPFFIFIILLTGSFYFIGITTNQIRKKNYKKYKKLLFWETIYNIFTFSYILGFTIFFIYFDKILKYG